MALLDQRLFDHLVLLGLCAIVPDVDVLAGLDIRLTGRIVPGLACLACLRVARLTRAELVDNLTGFESLRLLVHFLGLLCRRAFFIGDGEWRPHDSETRSVGLEARKGVPRNVLLDG